MFINYFASNDSMGDTSDKDCDYFRDWSESQLKSEYPNHEIPIPPRPEQRHSPIYER